MGNQTWQSRLLLLFSGLCVLALTGQTFLSTARWLNEPFPGFFVYENLTVGPYHAPGWTGARFGLRSMDRIIAVGGRELRSRAELYAAVRSAAAPTAFDYRVLRGAQTIDLSVPSMPFTFRDCMLSFGIYIVIGWAFLLIGAAPYLNRASSGVALPLCFMVLLVFIWFQSTFDFMSDGMWPKEIRIFALALTPSAAIHLALLLKNLNAESRPGSSHLAGIYGIGLLLGALNALTFFAPTEIWLPLYRSLYLYVTIGALAFILIVLRGLQRSQSDLDRSRLRVILVGAFLGFLIPAISTAAVTSLDLPIPYNVSLIPTIFFPISVAYALLKYSLFDLGNALKVALSRFGLVASLVAIYGVVALLLAPWAGQYAKDPLVPILFSILVVAVFNPLLRWLERIVDRYIYRQDYDPVTVQADISLFLRTLDNAPALARGFVERIAQRLEISSASVVYRSKHAAEFLTAATPSVKDTANTIAGEFSGIAELFASATCHSLSCDEAKTSPYYCERRDAVTMLFERCKAELLLPLVYERAVRGVLCVGPKRSGHEYSAEDLKLLVTLAEQLALSLENGQLYQESVTARQQTEEINKRLVEMDRVKKDFVANICHELRTPVSTIIGYSEILREQTFNADAREVLNRLINNSQELTGVMDNLMNFSRLEANGVSTQFEIVKLGEILNALEMMTQRLIRERPIEFGIHLESTVETIESDGQKLQQILVQLLTNALKFTEKGRIELIIRQCREAGKEMLEIAVADTGIGIKREDQAVIFDDFRQVEHSSTRHYGGTGLGLGLCKKLASALGGEMRVSSEYGVGSVFSLLLPVRVLAPAGAQ